jgi:hypothetical protein
MRALDESVNYPYVYNSLCLLSDRIGFGNDAVSLFLNYGESKMSFCDIANEAVGEHLGWVRQKFEEAGPIKDRSYLDPSSYVFLNSSRVILCDYLSRAGYKHFFRLDKKFPDKFVVPAAGHWVEAFSPETEQMERIEYGQFLDAFFPNKHSFKSWQQLWDVEFSKCNYGKPPSRLAVTWRRDPNYNDFTPAEPLSSDTPKEIPLCSFFGFWLHGAVLERVVVSESHLAYTISCAHTEWLCCSPARIIFADYDFPRWLPESMEFQPCEAIAAAA